MNQRVIARTGFLGTEFRVDELIASLSGRAWRTRSAGPGSKGERRLCLGPGAHQRSPRPAGRALAAGSPVPHGPH
jgi:hypothetical protein